MLQRISVTTSSAFPHRPLRLLIEDPELVAGDLAAATTAFEISACAGPHDGEDCPLVMDGWCPLGTPDVVVSALDGPWARSVRAAWTDAGTPLVDASDVTTTDPAARLRHHVGAALLRLWGPYVNRQ